MPEGEGVKAAIRELEEKLEGQLREVADTKKAINLLCSIAGEPLRFADVEEPSVATGSLRIRPDQYFGKTITVAARQYLKAKGSAGTVDEIIDALKRGGCDLGANPLKNIKISLSKNSKTFAQVSEDVFGLWEMYGGPPRKKAETWEPQIAEETKEEQGQVSGEEQK
jgi:hypothetical protein